MTNAEARTAAAQIIAAAAVAAAFEHRYDGAIILDMLDGRYNHVPGVAAAVETILNVGSDAYSILDNMYRAARRAAA